MKRPQLMEMELREGANSQIRELREDMERLESTIPTIPPVTTDAAINNLIDNSDYNWSHDAYLNPGITPATAGDPNQRAYNWYRMQRATALLVEDDANSLKGPGHSLFAGETADTPRWNRTEGFGELGETGGTAWDVATPLPNNFVTPGMRLLVQMLFRLRTATALPAPIQFFWSLWDNTNTPPAPRIIQGSAFTLNGAVFGPLGATTRNYKLIVDTDQGGQVESTVLTLNNTPAVLSANNGVTLTWPRYPGFTNVTIYVTVGGQSFIVGVIGNGAASFVDTGQTLAAVGGVPAVADTVAKASAVALAFTPTIDWQLCTFSIFAPQTYNASLTTGRQWLRGGILGLTGDPHQLQIDRIGLSTGNGVWDSSAHDKSVQSGPSTSVVSSTQGPPSAGPPPDDGEGRIACSTLDTLLDVCERDGSNERKVELGEIDDDAIERGIYLVSARRGRPNRVRRQRTSWSDTIYTIETRNGAGRRCSPSDLWLPVNGPEEGVAARRLSEGAEVWTRKNGSVQGSEITLYSVSIRGEEVRILETDGDRTYWAGNAGAHNAKRLEFAA